MPSDERGAGNEKAPGMIPGAGSSAVQKRYVSDLSDVLRRRPFLAFHDFELDLLAFFQSLETFTLNLGMMNEAVLRTVVRGNEPETLAVIEPLHLSCCWHCRTPIGAVIGDGPAVTLDYLNLCMTSRPSCLGLLGRPPSDSNFSLVGPMKTGVTGLI